LEKKIKIEEAVAKQAADILARLEKGLDRYIRQPSGQTEQALNLYTDNIRAFVQAKAKAQEELNKVLARCDKLKATLKALVDPTPVEVPAEAQPAPAVAPVRPAAVAPMAPSRDDGFANVVPTDLQDLVDENATPAPRVDSFSAANGIPGLEDLMEDAGNVSPMQDDPFASLVPNDSKDLAAEAAFLTPSAAGLDIDDGEFEALKNEAGLGDVNEGRRLTGFSIEDSISTLMFGDHNLAL